MIRRALYLVLLAAGLLAVPALGAAGDLDPTFGTAGKISTDFGAQDGALDMALQPDGKIVAAGGTCCSSPGGSDSALARYNADGTLDASFGVGGKEVIDVGGFDAIWALVLQPDGKIVAAGNSGVSGSGDFALARFNANGTLDAGFGTGGKVSTDFAGFDLATAVVLQPDGKVVLAGTGGGNFALARYEANGTLDASFGTGGKVSTDIGGSTDGAFAAVLQSDGRIVAAGYTFVPGSLDFALARYDADGSLDPTFGTGGKVTTDFGGVDNAIGLALQADGKLIAVGQGGPGDFTVARYNHDGTLDGSFGSGGKVTTDILGSDHAQGVALQANGKLVVAGQANSRDFALVRYEQDGTPDTSFGTGGKVTTDFGGVEYATGMGIQPDGAIVVAGQGGPTYEFVLARYRGDPTATHVSIDVKPGSDTNPITLGSNGVVPVAVLSSDTFDASKVDPSSVCFGDAEVPAERDCSEAHGTGHSADVNTDGKLDLLLHFETQQTGIDAGDTSACLTGRTVDGSSIEGCDSIVTQ